MSEFKSDSSVKRVVKNGFFSGFRFFIYALSSFFFIPFLIRQYGEESYGLIALAGFLTQYVGFLSGCIASSVSRFLNMALNESDWKKANEIFATAFYSNIGLALLQIPLFAFGLFKLHWLIEFPPALETDFRILVICNILIYVNAVVFGAISTPMYAANRMDLTVKIGVIGEVIRLVVLVGLILSVGAKLWIIGVVDLSMALIGTGITFIINRNLAKKLVIRWRNIAWKWAIPIMQMASWSILAELGQILFQRTDVWILNRFVDAHLAGVCASLLIWPNFALQMVKMLTSIIAPVIMIDYAHNRIERISQIILFLSRIFAVFAVFFCAGIMIFGEWVLGVWVGPEFRQYHFFMILMIIHFPLTLVREATWMIFPAFNKMQYLGISNILSGCLNIGLSLYAAFNGYGFAGVIVATAISLIVQRTILLSYFTVKLLKLHWVLLYKCYIPGICIILFFGVQALWFDNAYIIHSGIFSIVIGIVFSWELFIRDKQSRETALSILSGVLRKEG